jgi:hypothetical protein
VRLVPGLILAILLGCGALISADAANPAITAAETSIGLGLSGTYTHYHESLGGDSDSEDGGLGGIGLRASRLGGGTGLNSLYAALAYDFSGGFLGYNGFTQDGLAYRAQDRAFFNHVEVRLGRGFALTPDTELIPFFAGGYQNWFRNIAGSAGYGEFYQAGLAGIGLKLDVAATNDLVLSASAEGLAVMGGSVSAPALDFKGGFGTSGQESIRLGANWRLDRNWHVFLGLGVEHFNYTGSGLDNGFYEPPSSTLQVRSELGMSFGF